MIDYDCVYVCVDVIDICGVSERILDHDDDDADAGCCIFDT